MRALLSRSRVVALAPALALALIAAPAAAQTDDETAGYLATLVTPAGALPGWVTPVMANDNRNGLGLRVGYGRVRLESALPVDANTFGGSLDVILAGGRLSLSGTGGYLFPHCPTGGGIGAFPIGEKCDGFGMLGGEATARLISYEVNADGEGMLTVSLAARGGKAFVENSTVYSLSAALPIAMSVDVGRATTLVPFISPGATRGHVRTDVGTPVLGPSGQIVGTDSSRFDATGTRFMLSGGLAILGTRSGLGLHATVTRIFIADGETQFGVALSWNSLPVGGPPRRAGRQGRW